MSGLMTAKKAIERVREIQEKNEGAEKEWVNAKEFWLFLAKKAQKMPKSKNSFYLAFPFVGIHLNTKFQKITSNSSQDNLWQTDRRTKAQGWINRSLRFATRDQ